MPPSSVDAKELEPIVELGRARARVLLERSDFRAAHAALVPALLERKTLAGETVEGICREAIASESFSASDPGDAEGAVVARSAAWDGTAPVSPRQRRIGSEGRPPSAPDSLTGDPGGGRLAVQG